MLALIARAMTDKSQALSDTLARGLQLIQDLSIGQSKASSETRVIAALQRAIARLHKRSLPPEDTFIGGMTNEYAREWEMLWQQQSPNYAAATDLDDDHDHNVTDEANLQHSINPTLDSLQYGAFDVGNINFNAQLEEFSFFH